MNKKILNETKRAYADCQSQSDAAYQKRNLNFRASKAVPSVDACEIMCHALNCKSHVSGYNEFRPSHLLQLPAMSEVWLAREGSVCVYAKIPEGESFDQDNADAMMADEFSVEPNGSIRLWWD
jgi:hypothetical protein